MYLYNLTNKVLNTIFYLMTTTSDEYGIINNFAQEPTMYYAETPSAQEQRKYLVWGAIALVLVIASVFTATFVS
jgi:hypothetical protein